MSLRETAKALSYTQNTHAHTHRHRHTQHTAHCQDKPTHTSGMSHCPPGPSSGHWDSHHTDLQGAASRTGITLPWLPHSNMIGYITYNFLDRPSNQPPLLQRQLAAATLPLWDIGTSPPHWGNCVRSEGRAGNHIYTLRPPTAKTWEEKECHTNTTMAHSPVKPYLAALWG